MRYLFLSIFISFLSIYVYADDIVTISTNTPKTAKIGERFTITVTIKKLGLRHFAEYRQSLPKGFKVIENKSGSADFSLSEQNLRYIWLRLPKIKIVKFSYDLVIDSTVKAGTYDLNGKFIYIYNNQRGELDSKNVITIIGSKLKTIDASKKIVFPPLDSSKVVCYRIKPFFSDSAKSILVKLHVNRGNIKGVTKIVEEVPPGYAVNIIINRDANFSFSDNKAEFIWKATPEKQNFDLVYSLSPIVIKPPLPIIKGYMVYMVNSDVKNINVIQVKQLKIRKSNNSKNKTIDDKEVNEFFKN